ncbi:MAG: hypothetical protein O7A98_08360, partial [Acidobacteria bacterium]|nr:hypothetical protein [Acidobacteriota bacterium]
SATGPAITPAGQPFDLDVSWNEPAMKAEQFWFGSLAIGTDSGNPGNLGSIGVDIEILGPIFADGFESGDTSAWSNTVP